MSSKLYIFMYRQIKNKEDYQFVAINRHNFYLFWFLVEQAELEPMLPFYVVFFILKIDHGPMGCLTITMNLSEPLKDLFEHSYIVKLDFAQLDDSMPEWENIENYFKAALENNINPRLPENRQQFNNLMLDKTGARYLIGRYGEDRIAMLADTPAGKQGRTIHMAIDIFAKDLEPVYAPCDGEIIRSDYEEGFGEYGNYLFLKPDNQDFYIFFGHLSSDKVSAGNVKKGQIIAHLGDYANDENGGWSRHLHLQIVTQLPPEGKTPDGYSTKEKLEDNTKIYPNPLNYFLKWKVD